MDTTFKKDRSMLAIRNKGIGLFLVSGLLVSGWVQAEQYEPETITMNAATLLTDSVVRGPHYRVSDNVVNKGYMNHYKVESDFGVFEAASDEQLQIRIREVAAIAELKSLRKTEVFAKALAEAAQQPLEVVQNVVEKPVETLKGVPAGVGRLFKRTARKIKDTGEALEEYSNEQNQQSASGSDKEKTSGKEVLDKGVDQGKQFTMRKLGHSSAIRKLAKDLKVDPYSSNTVLQKEMSEVAWAMAAGSMTTSLAMPAMPSGFSELSSINDMVWDTDPVDLRLRNEALLKEMGVSESLTKSFFDNQYFSVTMQTRLIGSLNLLNGAKGKSILMSHAADAESRAEARLFGQIAETLVLYHQSRSAIVKILDSSIWPLGQSKNGNLIVIAPLDFLSWTQSVSEATTQQTADLKRISSNSKRELWVQGFISDIARAKLSALGWVVYDKSKERL
jgi:hypothetical protein